MSKSGDLWIEQHERAVERLVLGEDDRATFISNLVKLGMRGDDIVAEILAAEVEIAEAAHTAGARYYERYIAGDR